MYLFGGKFCKFTDDDTGQDRECTCPEIVNKHPQCECDRKHFNNFLWATVTVFQVRTEIKHFYQNVFLPYFIDRVFTCFPNFDFRNHTTNTFLLIPLSFSIYLQIYICVCKNQFDSSIYRFTRTVLSKNYIKYYVHRDGCSLGLYLL